MFNAYTGNVECIHQEGLIVPGEIVNAVKAASQQGIGVTRQQLLSRVGALCRSMGTSPFKKAIPSKDYWISLKKATWPHDKEKREATDLEGLDVEPDSCSEVLQISETTYR